MNTLTKHDFPIGTQVFFGRDNGQRTKGTVVGHGRTKLKVRQDEARGRNRNYKVGTVWTVPPSLCAIRGGAATRSTPTPSRPEADILAEARRIIMNLEPEILHQDGERSFAEARRVANQLRRRFRALETELGRPITEFGDIDGAMPVSLDPRRRAAPAKSSGFRKGDKVAFEDRSGRTVVGFVKRVNQKTISVDPIGSTNGRYWRVSPALCRAA